MEICPVMYALSILNGKWKMKIVRVLSQHKTVRFNELQRNLDGISAVMLSKNLIELENDGIIIRKQYNQVPPKVEYYLSELGNELNPALESLGEWGKKKLRSIQ